MTQDTAYEFAREELLIGPERIEKLRKSTVMVLGAGGVGSHCIEALARGGVGRLILVDADRVALSNINRQSIAYHSTVGRYKTQVMKERIRDICPETEVLTYEIFVLPDNLQEIFTVRPDYIVDAIDTVTAKISVIEKAKEMGVPVISCMGTGNKMHPELFEITDIHKTSVCPLCKVMRKELKNRGIRGVKVLYSKEQPVPVSGRTPGSISFVPPVAGLLIAGEVIRDLTGWEER